MVLKPFFEECHSLFVACGYGMFYETLKYKDQLIIISIIIVVTASAV